MKKILIVLKATCISAILLCTNIHGFFWSKKAPVVQEEVRIPTETREYTLKVGETFTISLPENMTTGYRWNVLVLEPVGERLIELVKTEYKPDSPEPVIGGGGTRTFTFRAKKATQKRSPGAANTDAVLLIYCREFSGEVAKIVDMRFTITE